MENILSSVNRIDEILSEKKKSFDHNHSKYNKINNGKIEFKDVSFSYDNKNNVLKRISFVINTGDKVTIVGSSESGTSTIINLLKKFYDVDNRAIYINDIDIEYCNLGCLREQIGLILQDPYIFNATIRENISLLNQNVIMENLEFFSKISEVTEFIVIYPNKYDEILDNKSLILSSGQKQQISFARAY